MFLTNSDQYILTKLCLCGGEQEVKAKCVSLPQNAGHLATLVDFFEKSILAIECDSVQIKALCVGQIVLIPFPSLFFGCPGLLITTFFPCPALINHYNPFILLYPAHFHFTLQCPVLFLSHPFFIRPWGCPGGWGQNNLTGALPHGFIALIV